MLTLDTLIEKLKHCDDPWQRGDLLLSVPDGELGMVARHLQIKKDTLALMQRVSAAWPEGTRAYAWGVYAALDELEDGARPGVLDSRESWTPDEMADAVREFKRNKFDGAARPMYPAGFTLRHPAEQDFRLKGTISADGRTITLTTPNMVSHVEVSDVRWSPVSGLTIVIER